MLYDYNLSTKVRKSLQKQPEKSYFNNKKGLASYLPNTSLLPYIDEDDACYDEY